MMLYYLKLAKMITKINSRTNIRLTLLVLMREIVTGLLQEVQMDKYVFGIWLGGTVL
jgi:hypothetical protein